MEEYLEPDCKGSLLGTFDSLSPGHRDAVDYFYVIGGGKFISHEMDIVAAREVDKDSGVFFQASEEGRFFDQLANHFSYFYSSFSQSLP